MPRPVIAALILAAAAHAQSPAPLRFEVCDVQIDTSGTTQVGEGFLPGGRVDLRNIPLRAIIAAVYKVPDSMITGPDWLASTRYDIVAKAPPTSTIDQLFEMMRTLLAERFGMVYHLEKKTLPVWTLVLGKKPLKLTEATNTKDPGCPNAPGQPGEPAGMLHRTCHAMPMSNVTRLISQFGAAYFDGLPVVDQTGLTGQYDLNLDWMNRSAYDGAVASGSGDAVSIFDAVEKIGLKLESRKQSVDTLVIDKLERKPTDN